jgi:methylthioribulose-1-phosphate dehydratase
MTQPESPLNNYSSHIEQMSNLGNRLWQRGWCHGGCSNVCMVTQNDPLQLLTIAEHRDRSQLTTVDFVLVDVEGKPVHAEPTAPPSQARLYSVLAEQTGAGCILHTHSVSTHFLSVRLAALGGLLVEGSQVLTALEGVTSHEQTLWLPILENSRDTNALADGVRSTLQNANKPLLGLIIQQNGLLSWGRDATEAIRHAEALEFMIECIARQAH